MKKYTTVLIVMLATTLVAASCKKDKPQDNRTELEKLPPITQIGANTFGCLVDGKAWLPNGSKPQNGGPNIVIDVDPTFQTGLFRIDAIKYNDGPGNFISINTFNCTSAGSYGFSPSTLSVQFYSRFSNQICELSTTVNSTYKGGILNIVRYDLTNRVFSGTFSFELFNPQSQCGDTTRITDGRFDVKL